MSLRARAADERGLTLPELLAAMSVGVIVLLATFGLIDASTTSYAKVDARLQAVQRGRLAMEQITQHLRSQVCLGVGFPPITAASDNSVTFYADLGDESFKPERHRVTYDPTTRSVTEQVETWNGTARQPTDPFPSGPVTTRTVMTNMEPITATPVFRYYAYSATPPIAPSVRLTTPLSSTDLGRAVLMKIGFVARPTTLTGQARLNSTFENDVYVRTANPDDPTGGSQCR